MTLEGINSGALSGVPFDYVPVTPSDSADLPDADAVVGLRIGGAGTVRVTTFRGDTRNLTVAAGEYLPLAKIRRVHSSGTTATMEAALA